MATSNSSRETFADSDIRHDEMHSTIEAWIQDLVDEVDDAVSSEQFKEWLDVQSRFHDYSHRNTLLIKLQCPHATRVAGYRTWQNEFDRHVKEGETTIWNEERSGGRGMPSGRGLSGVPALDARHNRKWMKATRRMVTLRDAGAVA